MHKLCVSNKTNCPREADRRNGFNPSKFDTAESFDPELFDPELTTEGLVAGCGGAEP
jgi:hypothetical protein